MSATLNEEFQSMAANAICHEAFLAGQVWQMIAYSFERPSVLYRPRLFKDGSAWCALYGDDIQVGACGFGPSPALAMKDFDASWEKVEGL
jgi:hypothetical protein